MALPLQFLLRAFQQYMLWLLERYVVVLQPTGLPHLNGCKELQAQLARVRQALPAPHASDAALVALPTLQPAAAGRGSSALPAAHSPSLCPAPAAQARPQLRSKLLVHEEYRSIERILGLYSGAALSVSSRLHPGVMAYAMRVPNLFLCFDNCLKFG